MPRTIGRRLRLHVRDILPAGYIFRNEVRKQAQPLLFGAALQHKTTEVEVVYPLSQMEAEVVPCWPFSNDASPSPSARCSLSVRFKRAIQ